MKAPRRPLLVKLLSQSVQYFFAGSKQLIKKKQQQKDRTTTHLLKGPVHPKSYKKKIWRLILSAHLFDKIIRLQAFWSFDTERWLWT